MHNLLVRVHVLQPEHVVRVVLHSPPCSRRIRVLVRVVDDRSGQTGVSPNLELQYACCTRTYPYPLCRNLTAELSFQLLMSSVTSQGEKIGGPATIL